MNSPNALCLPDTRIPWFKNLALRYVRKRVRNELDGLWVNGLETSKALCQDSPVIFAPNHVAWWDSMLLLCLEDALMSEGFAIMDQNNLKKLPFFKWLGAIGIQKSQPKQAIKDLRRAAEVLTGPRRSLWIFPQGYQRPSHLRPLKFKAGVVKLARWTQCPVVPVSIQYAYREAEVPSACFHFGSPLSHDEPELLTQLEHAVENGLSEIDRFLEGENQFTPIIQPRPFRSSEGLGARILAFLAEAA
ncbi:MAG: lysophospholipid acyltransferase family protein [Myxococcota bacterium]